MVLVGWGWAVCQGALLVLARVAEIEARRSFRVLILSWRKAALLHLPRVWMAESLTPAATAAVAAPILKL